MYNHKVMKGSLLFIVSLILVFIGVSLFITGFGLFFDTFFMIAGIIAAVIAFYSLIM